MRWKSVAGIAVVAMFGLASCSTGGGPGGGESGPTGAAGEETQSEETTDGAEGYPDRPLTLIVPFAPGGSSDIAARAIAAGMEASLGEPVNVVNQGGGGGVSGLTELMNAEPDGYTIGLAASGQFSVDLVNAEVPYTADDFAGFIGIVEEANMLTVRADAPWQSLDELVETGKGGETIQFGHSGRILDVLQSKLYADAGVTATGVPFQGGGESMTALLGGDVDTIAQSLVAGRPQVDAGATRFLATFSEERIPELPDVPTTEELGFEGLTSVARKFILLPGDTPEPIVAKVEAAVAEAMATPEYKEFLASSAANAPVDVTGDRLKETLLNERETYTAWMEELGLS